ncbi:hypothetical protein LOZ53_002845 [Ophidiomyces ophidiicola]|uniref:Uncharacterized protein n=1 Tax=Ophidiomyces ophidiicola TaxID=1387563 RepID=A0ACB8UU22_9EURO|nr:uncharacterized protein LOZ57_006436 [Ophidiomyces ophidiicola]KAI1909808.1 hypothetical protein LOZ64_005148 [Ophidiomyces ophidiicola]KAI1910834.1 hypothetical protein LOZ61_004176 [Ophidiomyces ophidiicola]KAI1923522.1 hypothetical protein LOZ60_005190 [Ophidiomyces ophidiicola]KAI1938267.1 hypothetical protein LOZ57_006436 [Ophidiomyces ophidiicola]KAI1944164.1 hypothetical protein LOZ62_004295 [Ophidiomyces ophidiicola]
MRATLRLLANVKPGRYLEPFAPTGLTGLATHPNPRPTLIYLYQSTLERLKDIPESSVYRKSTEALTRHRLNIVESVKPPGFGSWLERVKAAVAENPDGYKSALRPDGTYAAYQQKEKPKEDLSWSGEPFNPQIEGAYLNEQEMEARIAEAQEEANKQLEPKLEWEQEPALEASQISDIEQQIGSGLIEEVIQTAQAELNLVDEMTKAKVWEDLEQKPKPGQWVYFERGPSKS